jgi:hypothetical protein
MMNSKLIISVVNMSNPGLRFDTTGKPYNAAAGSPESFMSLGQAFISSAIARSAIAPQWEVRTAGCVGANDAVFEMRRAA